MVQDNLGSVGKAGEVKPGNITRYDLYRTIIH